MDIVTHAITGALVVASFSPQNIRRPMAVVGAIGASLPDLDVLIRSPSDPLLVLDYHRHFTHSLVFSPLGAALASLLLWPAFRRYLTPLALYLAVFAGYASACLLDVFTSYGTHLLWPFVPHPIALNMIAVVDPVFTLLVAVGLVLALSRRRALSQRSVPTPPIQPPHNSPPLNSLPSNSLSSNSLPSNSLPSNSLPYSLPSQSLSSQSVSSHNWLRGFGLVASAIYLCLGAFQLHRAENAVRQWAVSQQIEAATILVKPTLGNLVLWRALINDNGTIQTVAVRPGLMETKLYRGDRAYLVLPEDLDFPVGSRAASDIERFSVFANGYLVQYPGATEEIGDVRYAMLPTSVTPLWGIRVDRNNPDGPTEFFTRRDSDPAIRQTFLQMLAGKALRDTLPP